MRRLDARRVQIGGASAYTATVSGVEVVATRTGIGTRAATIAAEQLLRAGGVEHLVVVGIAGGVGTRVQIGDVVVPDRVLDASTGREYRPSPLGACVSEGTLLTSDELLLAPDIEARFPDEDVLAVEMEAAAVAAVCERHGCPWSVFRGISDRLIDGEVDGAVLGLARPDGSANVGALARYLLSGPWRIGRLARLGRGMKLAADAAADAAIAACAQHDFGSSA